MAAAACAAAPTVAHGGVVEGFCAKRRGMPSAPNITQLAAEPFGFLKVVPVAASAAVPGSLGAPPVEAVVPKWTPRSSAIWNLISPASIVQFEETPAVLPSGPSFTITT